MKSKSIHDKSYSILISKLREAREKKGMKQSELAEAIGVDQSFISKIENRERRLDLIELRLFCLALDLSLVEFVQDFEITIETQKGNNG